MSRGLARPFSHTPSKVWVTDVPVCFGSAAGFLIFATLVGRAITGPYKEWADSQIEVRLNSRHGGNATADAPKRKRFGLSELETIPCRT